MWTHEKCDPKNSGYTKNVTPNVTPANLLVINGGGYKEK